MMPPQLMDRSDCMAYGIHHPIRLRSPPSLPEDLPLHPDHCHLLHLVLHLMSFLLGGLQMMIYLCKAQSHTHLCLLLNILIKSLSHIMSCPPRILVLDHIPQVPWPKPELMVLLHHF